MIKNLIKRLFCNHLQDDLVFLFNCKKGESFGIFREYHSVFKCKKCGKIILRKNDYINKNFMNNYNRNDRINYEKAILFSFICNKYKDKSWKALIPDNKFEGYKKFVVGCYTLEGQIIFEYDIYPYWELFKDINEIEVSYDTLTNIISSSKKISFEKLNSLLNK